MKYLTVLAVVEVPDAVGDRSDDDLLKDVFDRLALWRTHDDVGRFSTAVLFATVAEGVTSAASAAGADESSWEVPRPLTARQMRHQKQFREAAWCWLRTRGKGNWCAVTGNSKPVLRTPLDRTK